MYLDFFKLERLPFRLSPDPQFVYWSAGHAQALACLKSAVAQHDGCAIISGDPGVGKTLMLECVRKLVSSDAVVAQVNQPMTSLRELLEALLLQLLDAPLPPSEPALQSEFRRVLATRASAGQFVVLMVDDAHLLGQHVLSAILQGSLVNSTDSAKPRILLAGQSGLDTAPNAASLERARVRVSGSTLIPKLAIGEIGPYVEHRLARAGAARSGIFLQETIGRIFEHTGGVPRSINSLCDAAMIAACALKHDQVTVADVSRALEDLRRMNNGPRPGHAGDGRRPVDFDTPASHASHAEQAVPAPSGLLARLTITHKGNPVTDLDLTAGRLRIGRTDDNELHINSHFISRHHCQILTDEASSMIEDVRSTNGLYVNERRVRRHRLRHGDVVTIGEHELHYTELRNQPPPPS